MESDEFTMESHELVNPMEKYGLSTWTSGGFRDVFELSIQVGMIIRQSQVIKMFLVYADCNHCLYPYLQE